MIFDDISAIGSVTLDCPVPDGDVACLLISYGYESFGKKLKNKLVLILKPTANENEYTRLGMSFFYETRNYTPEQTTPPIQPMTIDSAEDSEYDPENDDLENWFFDVDLIQITLL